jgi:DNA-binding MarR family transcriptional regulator
MRRNCCTLNCLGPKPKSKARERLRRGLLPGLVGYRLRLAHQAVFRDFAASVPQATPGRAGMLMLMEANPGVTQGRLATEVGLDRSTMVGVLHTLERAGLVERRRGEDRRTNGLWLTRGGRAKVAAMKRRIQAHERRIAAKLSAAERSQLLLLLEKLTD